MVMMRAFRSVRFVRRCARDLLSITQCEVNLSAVQPFYVERHFVERIGSDEIAPSV